MPENIERCCLCGLTIPELKKRGDAIPQLYKYDDGPWVCFRCSDELYYFGELITVRK